MKKLSELAKGEEATIIKVNCAGEIGKRLSDMGLISGNNILIKHSSFLGGPVHVNIIGYDLMLRKSEADYIWVNKK